MNIGGVVKDYHSELRVNSWSDQMPWFQILGRNCEHLFWDSRLVFYHLNDGNPNCSLGYLRLWSNQLNVSVTDTFQCLCHKKNLVGLLEHFVLWWSIKYKYVSRIVSLTTWRKRFKHMVWVKEVSMTDLNTNALLGLLQCNCGVKSEQVNSWYWVTGASFDGSQGINRSLSL